MSNSDDLNVNIDEKLATVRFICDNNSHIEVDVEKCKNCENKPCLNFCPANVYSECEKGTLTIDYENCLECGTCRICCPKDAIKWQPVKGAKGVTYRYG